MTGNREVPSDFRGDRELLGRRIKKIREETGMSWKHIANELGLSVYNTRRIYNEVADLPELPPHPLAHLTDEELLSRKPSGEADEKTIAKFEARAECQRRGLVFPLQFLSGHRENLRLVDILSNPNHPLAPRLQQSWSVADQLPLYQEITGL